jgi:hypothetical protein
MLNLLHEDMKLKHSHSAQQLDWSSVTSSHQSQFQHQAVMAADQIQMSLALGLVIAMMKTL